jgi:Ca2+-binding RTX toxin-like protein
MNARPIRRPVRGSSLAIAVSLAAGALLFAAPGASAVTCTISGSDGNDTLVGTSKSDVICGLGGSDTINGRGGDDTLVGGKGKDTLIGGPGSDTLDGGGGRDAAHYEHGATQGVVVDLSTGGATNDGQGFAETFVTNGGISSVESVVGTPFADFIDGDDGRNRLIGGSANDILEGLGGSDLLRGDDGNDALLGGADADTLMPGVGSDALSGGAGPDTLNYSDVSGGVFVELSGPQAHKTATDTFDSFPDGANIENVIGTQDGDILFADFTGTASFIGGLGGNDSLDTVDSDTLDQAAGGDGTDKCTVDPGDFLFGCE